MIERKRCKADHLQREPLYQAAAAAVAVAVAVVVAVAVARGTLSKFRETVRAAMRRRSADPIASKSTRPNFLQSFSGKFFPCFRSPPSDRQYLWVNSNKTWSCVRSNLDLSRCVKDGGLLLNVLCSGANSGNENSIAMPWQQLFIHFDYLYRLRIREDQLWMLGEVNESN